ncbi:baseplate wedge subunit [Acidovorax phage ACP17]|uniref:Uncharacterized protein n=1 Tax=Acidovorax phage ACP17 TaxID=2010329 RepID=A0A218M2U0_9CAUD|nr:baseplate wedge subunit [Acidovorax phage ACP17]ASD50359.1 hypothetical protein [Acidovorax phage ACP17]
MTSDLTNHYITSAIAAIAASADPLGTPWAAKTRYVEGSKVRSGPRVYLATTTGVTSTIAPVHSSGRAQDGTVTWAYVMTAEPNTSLAANYYLGIGSGGGSTAQVEDTPAGALAVLESLKTVIRINSRDVSLGFARRNWTSGTVVPAWPAPLSYAMVGRSVYRCIDNNGGAASTSAPAGTSLEYFELVDGYVWKYLGDLSASQEDTFGTAEVAPISSLYVNDGSPRSVVQSVAKSGSISGFALLAETGVFSTPTASIVGAGTQASARVDLNPNGTVKRVIATSGGVGYKTNTLAVISNFSVGSGAAATATVTAGAVAGVNVTSQGSGYVNATAVVVGDGQDAELAVTVTGGYVTGITVVNPGTGYTKAQVFVVPGTAAAVAEAVLSPIGGHGRDMTKELPINYLLVSRRLTSLDSGYIPTGEFNQLSILTGVEIGSGIGDIMVGPAHPSPAGRDAAVLSWARPIYVGNIAATEHSDAQDEEIRIALKVE